MEQVKLTSETIMKDRFSALPTSVLCQKLVDGDLASWQEKWASQIISQRGVQEWHPKELL